MRTVNQATQDAWDLIAYTKKRVYLPDLNISISAEHIGSINMTESISDTDCLFFVGCTATKVELTLNDFDTDIDLETIEVYAQRENTTELKIFTGKVYTADLDGRNNTMHVIAYDALYRIFNKDFSEWYRGLTFPMTIKQFRDAFFLEAGVTQNAATLLFDSLIYNQTVGGETMLGRDLIKPLCEANVCFGHIDYKGDMSYITPTANNRTVPVGEVSDMTKAEFQTSLIDKVIVRTDEEDIGAVAGYGSNAYIIQGNMFFLGLSAADLQTIAEDILDALDSITYRPLQSTQDYNPIYELGDLITVPDGFGNTYQTIILNRDTDLQRETVTAKGLKEYSQASSYTNTDLITLLGKTNRLYRDVEQTRSTITDVAAGLQTEITQTAAGLQLQITDLQEQIDGETSYYERATGAPTLLNYPYWDFCTNIPCNGTVQVADDLGFIYTEQDRKEHRSDLCYVDDTNIAYRFVLEEGVWFWKEIADSDYTQVLSRLSTLEATAEELTSEYTTLSVTLANGYYTKVQTDSKISQSASEIQTTVSATYATKTTTNSLQSQITQQAGQINAKVSQTGGSSQSFGWSLLSNKFKLTSNGTDVFECDANGIKIRGNATFTGTVDGATIIGGTLQGQFTMAQNASFQTLQFQGSAVSKTAMATFTAFSQYAYPTMKYSSELQGYVPVCSSSSALQGYTGLGQYATGNYILTTLS